MKLKVEEHSFLFRDSKNQAILNTDMSALQAYKQKKRQSAEIDRLSKDINNIKSEMNDLKVICMAIMERVNG
jgi:cell division protein FtsB